MQFFAATRSSQTFFFLVNWRTNNPSKLSSNTNLLSGTKRGSYTHSLETPVALQISHMKSCTFTHQTTSVLMVSVLSWRHSWLAGWWMRCDVMWYDAYCRCTWACLWEDIHSSNELPIPWFGEQVIEHVTCGIFFRSCIIVVCFNNFSTV